MAVTSFTQKIKQIKEKESSERLMKEVAEELGISFIAVKDVIVNGQSKFTAHTMKNNSFNSVRWPLLGKFTATIKTAQVLKHLKGLNEIQREFFLNRKENQRVKRHLNK